MGSPLLLAREAAWRIRKRWVKRSILAQIEERQEKVAPKVAFEKGETVKVNDGPFQNFTGVIDEIDPDRGKLKISVSIFGRSTPVELEYWQVERS